MDNRKISEMRNLGPAAFLYALYGAVEDVAWQDVPEPKRREFKAVAARLRRKYA